MNTRIIASAGTKEKLQELINQFYCSENWIIDTGNKIFNTKLKKFATGVRIVYAKNRWRFEMM